MRTIVLPLAVLALTACSPQSGTEAQPEPSPSTAPFAAAPSRLAALAPADLAANPLDGELGCSFSAGEDTLLVAMSFVAAPNTMAEGLARTEEGLQRLVAQEPGGFDALLDGTIFTSRGTTFTITRTGDEPLGTGESPAYPAELLVRQAGGAQQAIAGTWTCGP